MELQTAASSALTAACYDDQARGLERELPGLWFPEDEFAMADCEPDWERLVGQEGWTYCLDTMSGLEG